ncbi:MAG: hypothetical protein KDD02_23535 [Phaeodactylibacter sp.]|nr:hypothetical protein [Phaeodactylibacter sp.]MCB9301769.1 hypothetical protein [Lewinellaceae bacterium]
MRRIIFFLLAGSLLFLTSCIETLEEVYLNKNGSGKYSITFDMSEFMSNPMMKGMLEEAAKGEGMDSGLNLENMDTIIHLGNEPGAGEAMKKALLHLTMNEAQGKFVLNMSLPFDNVGQIDQFFKELNEQGAGSGASSMAGGTSMFMPGGLFEFSKKKLTRKKAEQAGQNELLAGEEGEFVKMFFASGTHKTVYYLPGTVKKTSIDGAVVDGKTVTVERPLLDMMEGKVGLEGEIRFR